MKLTSAFLLVLLLLSLTAKGQQTLCDDELGTYSVDVLENNGLGTIGSTYVWTVSGTGYNGVMTPLTSSNNQINIDWTGSNQNQFYDIDVIETSPDGCATVTSLTVFYDLLPVVELTDLMLCEDENGDFYTADSFDTLLDDNLYDFSWTLNGVLLPDSSAALDPVLPGVYEVTVTELTTGCSLTSAAVATTYTALSVAVNIGADFTDNQRIIVTVSGGVAPYEYQFNEGPWQSDRFYDVTQRGINTVRVRDNSPCDTRIVEVISVNYPKFFTPNDDGFHDLWQIKDLPNPALARISIMDRFGKLLKQMGGESAGWDGMKNGAPLPSTDYWFILDYVSSNGQQKQFKSNFTLKR